jgi:hypothetical protein
MMLCRRFLLVLLLAVSVPTVPACTVSQGFLQIVRAPNPVQMTVAAADAVDAAIQLGEVVEQLRATSHRLAQARVLPLEADNVVQQAAIDFANAKDRGVKAMASSTTLLQLIAAAAPMIGEATKIRTTVRPVATLKSPGVTGMMLTQLPPLLKQLDASTKTLSGEQP